MSGLNFDTAHAQAGIFLGGNIIRYKRLGERWPTSTRFKFILRAEKWLSRNNVYIDSLFLITPVVVYIRGLSTIFLRDSILKRG
jgi:hypothetical protein